MDSGADPPRAPPGGQEGCNDSRRMSLGSLMGKPKPVFGGTRTSKAARTVNPLAQSQDRGLLFSLQPSADEEQAAEGAAALPTLTEGVQLTGSTCKMPPKGSTWWGGAIKGQDPEDYDTCRAKEDQQHSSRDQGERKTQQQQQQEGCSSDRGLMGPADKGRAEEAQCWSGRSSFHSTELLCSPSALQNPAAHSHGSPRPAPDALTREQSFEDAQHSFDRRGSSAEPPSPPSVSKSKATTGQEQAAAPADKADEKQEQECAASSDGVGAMAEQPGEAAAAAAAAGAQAAAREEVDEQQHGQQAAPLSEQEAPARLLTDIEQVEQATPEAVSRATPEKAACGTVDALSQLRMYDVTPPPPAVAAAAAAAAGNGMGQVEEVGMQAKEHGQQAHLSGAPSILAPESQFTFPAPAPAPAPADQQQVGNAIPTAVAVEQKGGMQMDMAAGQEMQPDAGGVERAAGEAEEQQPAGEADNLAIGEKEEGVAAAPQTEDDDHRHHQQPAVGLAEGEQGASSVAGAGEELAQASGEEAAAAEESEQLAAETKEALPRSSAQGEQPASGMMEEAPPAAASTAPIAQAEVQEQPLQKEDSSTQAGGPAVERGQQPEEAVTEPLTALCTVPEVEMEGMGEQEPAEVQAEQPAPAARVAAGIAAADCEMEEQVPAPPQPEDASLEAPTKSAPDVPPVPDAEPAAAKPGESLPLALSTEHPAGGAGSEMADSSEVPAGAAAAAAAVAAGAEVEGAGKAAHTQGGVEGAAASAAPTIVAAAGVEPAPKGETAGQEAAEPAAEEAAAAAMDLAPAVATAVEQKGGAELGMAEPAAAAAALHIEEVKAEEHAPPPAAQAETPAPAEQQAMQLEAAALPAGGEEQAVVAERARPPLPEPVAPAAPAAEAAEAPAPVPASKPASASEGAEAATPMPASTAVAHAAPFEPKPLAAFTPTAPTPAHTADGTPAGMDRTPSAGMDRGSSMDAATAARLAHELGVALAMESYAGSLGSRSNSGNSGCAAADAVAPASTPLHGRAPAWNSVGERQPGLGPKLHTTPCCPHPTPMPPCPTATAGGPTQAPGQMTAPMPTAGSKLHTTAGSTPGAPAACHTPLPHPTATPHATQASSGWLAHSHPPPPATPRHEELGLIDLDREMEDVSMEEQYGGQVGEDEGGLEGGAMPPLEATPSPGPASPAGPSAGGLHAQMQICRDSIPLFVRDSFAVTDSVSLERQSLNGLEPFGRAHLPMQAAPASAVPQTPAAPLGTLHEEASFMEELPPKPMAELQRPSQTPGAMQRSAVRAARAASAAGFDDHDLSDLPDNLPDPMMISPAPAPPPQQPRPQDGPTVPARPQFTSPTKPPLPTASPAPPHPSVRKPAQPSPHAHAHAHPLGTHHTPSAAAAADARARMGLPATHTHTPTTASAGATTPRLGGATPNGSGRLTPRGAYSGGHSSQGVRPGQDKGTPHAGTSTPNGSAPSPRLSRGGAADASSMSLSAQRQLGKTTTPSSARRTHLPSPMTYGNSPAAASTPPSASRTLNKSSSVPSSLYGRQQPGHHATPGTRTPSFPGTHVSTPSGATQHSRPPGASAPAAVATPMQAATPVGHGHIPTAVMPTLPASLNTPMAMMQQLPMEMAINAPLLDQGSPFSEMDFGMDTTNIAEEAKRLMQSLAGPGGGSQGVQTPEASGKVPHPVSHMKGTPADFKFASLGASQQTTPLTSRAQPPTHTRTPVGEGAGKTPAGGAGHQGGALLGLEGSDISPGQAGFLETQNRMLMERLVTAEERAQAAEREVEQLRDQIKTINFGDMLQENGAGDMEHEARLYAEEQLQVSKAEVSGMQETVRNMQQALTDTKATNSSQAAELKELRASSAKDRQQLGHLLGQVAQLEAELAAEREQARKMSVELSAARQRLTHAEATSEARGAEISKLARQRDEAQGSLKHSTEELIAEQLRNKQQVAEATKQATAMQASLTKLQADKDALKRDGAAVYARAKAGESQAAAYKADVQRLKQENGELVRMAEELMCSLEKERQKNRAAGRS